CERRHGAGRTPAGRRPRTPPRGRPATGRRRRRPATPVCARSRTPAARTGPRTLPRRRRRADRADGRAGSHGSEGSRPLVLATARPTFLYPPSGETYHASDTFCATGALIIMPSLLASGGHAMSGGTTRPRRSTGTRADAPPIAAVVFGILSLCLGAVGLPLSIIPCLNFLSLPLVGIGLVFGIVGFAVAKLR